MDQDKLIQFYQSIIDNQSSSYYNLITAMIGISALLIGSTWLWNFLAAKNQIRNEVIKQTTRIEREMNDKFSTLFNEKVAELESRHNNQLLNTEADLARIYAVHCETSNDIQNAFDWWVTALEKYISVESHEMTRLSIEQLSRIIQLPNISEIINMETFNPEVHIEIVKKAPILLQREKTIIIRALEKYIKR